MNLQAGFFGTIFSLKSLEKVSKVVHNTNTALNNKISLLLTVTPSLSAHLKTLEAEGLVGKFELKKFPQRNYQMKLATIQISINHHNKQKSK